MPKLALAPGAIAVVTGAAMGIGRAAGREFAARGLRIVLADRDEEALGAARDTVAAIAPDGAAAVLARVTDVADADDVAALKADVEARFGTPTVLMNNAVTRIGGGALADPSDWRQAFEVNLWGIVNGVAAFVPDMIAANRDAVVINVGSKQGITNPPGNAAYNATKAALKAYTESLQHELRNTEGCQVSAHLLIPGWTTTGTREHRPGAWLPDQVVDRLIAGLETGDFYILCQDGEVTAEMDRDRILWAALDITENRPPLSRWHRDFAPAFKDWDGRS